MVRSTNQRIVARSSKRESSIVGQCSGGRLAVFGVVDVDQPPLPGFSAVDLSFDAMGGHGRSVFPHGRMKSPVEFRPPRVAAHMDRHPARLKIACREHAAHDVLKDLLLDGIEAVLLAQWIDERDLGRVRPDLPQQVQIDSIDSFGILLDEVVDCRDVAPRARVGLGGGERGHETEKSPGQNAGDHSALSVYRDGLGMRL